MTSPLGTPELDEMSDREDKRYNEETGQLWLSPCCGADIYYEPFQVNEMNVNEYAFRVCRCIECDYKWVEEYQFKQTLSFTAFMGVHNEDYR